MLVSTAGLMNAVRVSWLQIYLFESVRVFIFSRDEATLYERVSVRPSVGPLVGWLVGHAFAFRPTMSD